MAMMALLPCLGVSSARADPLVLGVVPQHGAEATIDAWSGLASSLSQSLGREVALRVAVDIEAFESCLAVGAFDIAYMSPLPFVVFSEQVGYEAVVHREGRGLTGIVVARHSDVLVQLEDLEGQRLSFPAPGALGATVLVLSAFRERGIRVTPVFVRSHESVYRTVAAGVFPAGGGVRRTLATLPTEIQDDLVVIFETPEFTPHAIAVHPSLEAGLKTRITRILREMGERDPAALAPLEIPGWRVPAPNAYDDVRALGIDPSEVDIETRPSTPCPFARS